METLSPEINQNPNTNIEVTFPATKSTNELEAVITKLKEEMRSLINIRSAIKDLQEKNNLTTAQIDELQTGLNYLKQLGSSTINNQFSEAVSSNPSTPSSDDWQKLKNMEGTIADINKRIHELISSLASLSQLKHVIDNQLTANKKILGICDQMVNELGQVKGSNMSIHSWLLNLERNGKQNSPESHAEIIYKKLKGMDTPKKISYGAILQITTFLLLLLIFYHQYRTIDIVHNKLNYLIQTQNVEKASSSFVANTKDKKNKSK